MGVYLYETKNEVEIEILTDIGAWRSGKRLENEKREKRDLQIGVIVSQQPPHNEKIMKKSYRSFTTWMKSE